MLRRPRHRSSRNQSSNCSLSLVLHSSRAHEQNKNIYAGTVLRIPHGARCSVRMRAEGNMRKLLIGLVILVAVIIGAVWAFSVPDIPRGDLEAKYATAPSQFIVLPDGARAHVR